MQIKKKLHIAQRNSNDINLTEFYKEYCKILTSVIKLAKKKHTNNIIRSNNKIKAMWNIVKSISNIKPGAPNIYAIRVNGNLYSDAQIITEEFNKYFISAVPNNHSVNVTPNHENPTSYLCRECNQPFSSIALKCILSKEIEDIIKSLKTKKLMWV
jgi:hypothetical protein